MPFFSVIIPLYNKEHFIINTLKSVLVQTFSDWEIIIVNDGSTDQSEVTAKTITDKRIRFFNKKNGGVSSARNFGIVQAKSSYITFLDADDYWYPDFLETMHAYILMLPQHKIWASAIEIETSQKIFEPEYAIDKSGDYAIVDYFENSLKESVIWTSAAVFDRKVFETSGVFNEQLKVVEDIDLWIRIGLHFKIVFIWKVLSRYVYDGKSLSRNQRHYTYDNIFDAYAQEEKKNPALKKFLDLNRFSMAIKSKIIGDHQTFKKLSRAIASENLTVKKKILLQIPGWLLRLLIKLNQLFVNIGLMSTVFR